MFFWKAQVRQTALLGTPETPVLSDLMVKGGRRRLLHPTTSSFSLAGKEQSWFRNQ